MAKTLYELRSKRQEVSEELKRCNLLMAKLEDDKLDYLVTFAGTMDIRFAHSASIANDQINSLRKHIAKLERDFIILVNEIDKQKDFRDHEQSFFYGVGNIDILEELDKYGYLNGFKC